MKLNRLFSVCVLLPTALATLYFGLVASDVYVSESRFVVRTPERQTPTTLGLVLKGAGFSRSAEDAHAVHDYILSRDAVRQLDEQLGIRARYARPEIDWFSRYGTLTSQKSFESFHRHYQRHVDLQLDTASSIGTLTVRAYSAEDAQAINQKLLNLSELLVNRLNERGRKDLVEAAQRDYNEAEQRAKRTALALADFRDKTRTLDPERQATLQLQQVASLQTELTHTKAQLAQLQSIGSQNPQIALLRAKIRSLESAISTEGLQVTGGAGALSGKARGYQALQLDNEFALKHLAAAMASLEQAKSDANRQQLYLETIATPNRPDAATEPKRLKGILATLLGGLMAWGILTILASTFRDHLD